MFITVLARIELTSLDRQSSGTAISPKDQNCRYKEPISRKGITRMPFKVDNLFNSSISVIWPACLYWLWQVVWQRNWTFNRTDTRLPQPVVILFRLTCASPDKTQTNGLLIEGQARTPTSLTDYKNRQEFSSLWAVYRLRLRLRFFMWATTGHKFLKLEIICILYIEVTAWLLCLFYLLKIKGAS